MPWLCGSCGGENPEGTRFCGHCGASTVTAPAGGREAEVSAALKSFVSSQVAGQLAAAGREATQERRLVTCLFADLSGFTTLADRLDPEQLLEVIDPVINRLTDIVGRYDGYVDKFAGDALLAFFGAPIAHEDDASRALLVALEMHRELERMLPDLPTEAQGLTLHCGVNSGHVVARVLGTEVRMDYSVLGDAVILAQRLESIAPAGETYVGRVTHMLTQGRFEFEPVGEVTLKGKAQPVAAWRLVGEKRFAGRPLARTMFVGRQAEMESITAALDALLEGPGGVVSLSGEAGVGKSRLMEEARHRAEARGINWLPTRCISYGSSIAYWPYSDLLRRMIGIRPQSSTEEMHNALAGTAEAAGLSEWHPYFARLLGLPAPEIAHLDPESFRHRLHEAFEQAARALVAAGPAAFVVEDVHWADASSIALTTHLTRVCRELPVMLLLTARTDAAPVLLEIAAGVDESLRRSIHLEPFDDSTTEELIDSVLGGPAPPAVLAAVRERSAGNPLYLEEMIRALQDDDRLVKDNGHWTLAAEADLSTVPPTLEGILSARIDRLPRRAASILQVSSVIGRRVRVPLLKAVEEEAPDVDETLNLLVEGGFFDYEEGHRFSFHHALILDVAYSRLLRRHRRELHLKVADAAERLYGAGDDVIDLLARHLYLGNAGAKAVDYLVKAGERAKRLFSNEEAIQHFERAAELCRAETNLGDRLPEVLLSLGDLHELRGSYDEALRLYEEVRDATSDVRAWRGMTSSYRNLGELDTALTVLDEACSSEGLPDGDRAELSLERAWTYARAGRYHETIDAAREGLALIGTDSQKIKADLLLKQADAETMVGSSEDAIAHGEEAIEILEREEDLLALTTALRTIGYTYHLAERLDEAEAALRRGLELARHTGNAEETGGCLINLELVLAKARRYEEAAESGRTAIEHFEKIGHVPGVAMGCVCLSEVMTEKGDLEEAMDFAQRALHVARSIDLTPTIADANWNMGRVHLLKEEYAKALERAEESLEMYLGMEAVPQAKDALELAADALEGLGEKQRARETRSRARSLNT